MKNLLNAIEQLTEENQKEIFEMLAAKFGSVEAKQQEDFGFEF